VPLHFSVRDVTFTPTDTGVEVVVKTDVPCRLICRQTSTVPQIHKKPVLRRGEWLADDVRFCFVVYTDHEQEEPGDTLIHTFIKEPWAPCTTKWMYFWATIAGEVCVSTSAIFTHHNPVPIPGHYHPYTIWAPDGSIYLWSAILPSVFDATKPCPSGHPVCQWIDAVHFNPFDTRHEETLNTDRREDEPGHQHLFQQAWCIEAYPSNMHIYINLYATCPDGHPHCAAFEATSGHMSKKVGLRPILTSGPYYDGNGRHRHYFSSLRSKPMVRYINDVFACPNGHPKCQVSVVEEDPMIFDDRLRYELTGFNEGQ